MEKRELTRVVFNIEAVVKYGTETFIGKAENLSLKGIFIRTDQKLKPQDEVELSIRLAGGTSDLEIQIKGIVVRTTPEGIGIQFQMMDLDSFIHLRNIVAYNSGDEDKIMEEFFQFINHKSVSEK